MPLQLAIAHRALAISEILVQIVGYVRMGSNWDALNLGLTCRACIETVLDELWNFATLLHLARVFPARVLIWSKSEQSEQDTIVRRVNSFE
jgi:hypothetical protein